MGKKKQILTIFLHIPKTGGTTLNSIFTRQYTVKEFHNHDLFDRKIIPLSDLNEEHKKRINAVSGHHFYGIHEHFNKSHRYFTMLRHPVDRVLSLYYYLMENDYPGYEWMKEMTLEEFVEATPEAQNNQTTLLCGYPINPDVNIAKERIKSFDMVGITELFNESLFLLKKTFNWKNIDYRRVNITKSRLTKEELPEETIRLIEKYNEMDMEVYLYAKGLLLSKMNTLSVKEKWKLQQFVEKQKNIV
ncbi:sulfotransferase family 2 domain-containing protein [Niallia taxi]|nr:sulfotransferase family 2 domain-containing protein [Niallia taxi]MDE5053276.1 sulfotransferase family 2 domain-containing protein [Niallia taxi]